MDLKKLFLQVFFVLAFVLGQVSPACAFVSGKMSLLEICSADGSLKTIKVSDAFDPLSQNKTSKHEKMGKDCAFCFAQAHIAKIFLYSDHVQAFIPSSYRISGVGTISPKTLKFHHSQPRAPPVLS